MHKKGFAILALVLVIALSAFTSAPAATIKMTEELTAAFANEPPLTAEEVEVFIAHLPEFMAAGQDPAEDAVMKVAAPLGWSDVRTAYISTKVGIGYTMLLDPQSIQGLVEMELIPAASVPTPAELELIKQRQSALDAVFAKE